METMTIATTGGIRVSCENGFTVNALRITIIGVAGRACLDHTSFIPFPRRHLVNVFVAVLALNVIDEMGTRIMFCPFLFMTSMTGDWLAINSRPSCLHMGFDISDIPVTTIAGVGSMNGLCKFPLADLFVAPETFGVVDTL
jgi:hypothetical protein